MDQTGDGYVAGGIGAIVLRLSTPEYEGPLYRKSHAGEYVGGVRQVRYALQPHLLQYGCLSYPVTVVRRTLCNKYQITTEVASVKQIMFEVNYKINFGTLSHNDNNKTVCSNNL